MKNLLFKLILLTILITGLSYVTNAQDKEHKNFLRVGFQSAQLSDSGKNYYSNNREGFYIGIMRQRPFAGILFSQVGLEYHQNGSEKDGNNWVKLDYIAIPANIGVRIGPVKAYGGATAALKIASNEKILGIEDKPEDGKYNDFDATAYLGASFKIWFLGLDLQYHWGLVNVIDNYKNNYLQIGANLYF